MIADAKELDMNRIFCFVSKHCWSLSEREFQTRRFIKLHTFYFKLKTVFMLDTFQSSNLSPFVRRSARASFISFCSSSAASVQSLNVNVL